MRRLIILLIIAGLGWYGYTRYEGARAKRVQPAASPVQLAPLARTPTAAAFTCDGRTYCSQMTSCAEATYFLKNCPGVKMDGNNDGVPCEQQWCK
jgi:hypothetical protein